MPNLKYVLFFMFMFVLDGISLCNAQTKEKLFFREDWKQIAAATPATQEHVGHPDLILSRYGPAKNEIKKSNHPEIPNDPYYIWSGDCKGNWAITLKHKLQRVDLTGPAKIKWRAKQSGFRELRIILKLADGGWLVSDHAHVYAEGWQEKEFIIADLKWRKLTIETVIEGNWVQKPDLSMVEEIGFTDLMTGGGTPASSRLDWIEVYGKAIEKK